MEAELLLDRAERMLDFGTDVCLGGFDQILKLSISGVWQGPAFSQPHHHPKLR